MPYISDDAIVLIACLVPATAMLVAAAAAGATSAQSAWSARDDGRDR